MALKFLSNHHSSGSGSSKDVKVFEIRLDNDYIVFRGSEDEAASAPLSGSLVLCLADALMIHHVKLTVSGILHMSYLSSSTSAMSGRRVATKEKAFYEKTWTFVDAGKGRSELLPSDNYEWRFDTVLDGSLPESVEGLKDAWVVYRLKAEICRKRGKDIVVRKPLRIVRTLDPTTLELSHAMSVENIWPDKIEYSISTPSKAVIFGSFLQVDFKLVPLLKGLEIGNVATQLKEEQEYVVDPEWGVAAMHGGMTREDRIIAWDNYRVKREDEEILDEVAEGFQFSRYLELPKTLSKCVQDCNVKGIRIRHKIKFNVQLHNPDGHISELRANLPVSLYISPSLPLNENNDLVDQSPQATRAAIEHDLAHSAPPLYGQHTLDQLYSGMDVNGYRTPGPAFSSPGTPYSQSRNISSENLASLDTVTNASGHVSAAALQSRLQNLRMSDRGLPTSLGHDDRDQPQSGQLSRRGSYNPPSADYFSPINGTREPSDAHYALASPNGNASGHSSQSESARISRQSSAEEQHQISLGTRDASSLTAHFEDLAKVPSYSTAVKTPAPRGQDTMEALPSYGAVLSESNPGTPSEPAHAYVHAPRSGNWSEDNIVAAATATANVFGQARPTTGNRFLNTIQEEERRRRSIIGRG